MLTHLVQHAREEFQALEMSFSQLRKFGWLVGAIFLLLSAYFSWRDADVANYVCAGVGILLIIGGLVFPRALRTPYRLWMLLAVILGFFVGNTILMVLYYVIVTPLGLLQRLVGNDPLERAFDPVKPSYWKAHEKRQRDHMKHPF